MLAVKRHLESIANPIKKVQAKEAPPFRANDDGPVFALHRLSTLVLPHSPLAREINAREVRRMRARWELIGKRKSESLLRALNASTAAKHV